MLGVTPATVSKAIKGAPDVSPATRERVLGAMAEHGMKIERERRTMGRAVLVVTPEFGSEFYAARLSSIHRALAARGLMMLTMSVEFDNGRGRQDVERYLRHASNICGVMILDNEIEIHCELPCVFYSSRSGGVDSEYYNAMTQALMHLRDRGRRRIAFVGEPLTGKKQEYFIHAAKKLGMYLGEQYVYVSRFRFERAGADGFQALFSLDEPPDAIFCGYDYIALGVLNAAEAAGVKVPDDLAVIGSDNVRAAGAYRLGLTTIGVNHENVAEALVELLLRRIEHPEKPEQPVIIPAELYLRGTT